MSEQQRVSVPGTIALTSGRRGEVAFDEGGPMAVLAPHDREVDLVHLQLVGPHVARVELVANRRVPGRLVETMWLMIARRSASGRSLGGEPWKQRP